MPMYKTAAVCLSVLLLAACGNENEQLQSFYKQIEKANEKEKPIVETSDKLSRLENEKVQMFEKINKGTLNEIHAAAKKLAQNADNREEVVTQEKEAIAASEAAFKKSLPLAKAIDNQNNKKEAQDIIDKMEKKYSTHAQLMTAYKAILTQEQNIFKYLQQPQPAGHVVNEKIDQLGETTKKFQQLTTVYNTNSKALEKEKKDVVDLLNQ